MARTSAEAQSTARARPRLMPVAQLGLAWAGIALPLFALLVLPMPVWAGQPVPRPQIGAATAPLGWEGAVVAIGSILFLCLPYRPYTLALRSVAGAASTRSLVALTAPLALIGLLTYPRFGSDVFDYAAYERMWVVYGENPLVAVVANHADDWIAPFVNVPDRTPAYGPAWAMLTWPIVRLAGDSALAEVVGYKVLAAVAFAACCWLVWASVEPPRRQRAVIMFAWSPLVLFEALGKVHNDLLMALGILGAVWLASHHRMFPAMLAATLGSVVKGTALVAAPPLVVQAWREGGWRKVAVMLLAGLFLAAVSYAPFWSGPETFASIWRQTAGLGWSLATILTVGAARLIGGTPDLLVRGIMGLAWASLCLMILKRWAGSTARHLAASTGWLLIASLLLLTGAVYGHYFIPAAALAAVAGDALLEDIVMWLSIGGLAVYGVGALGWVFVPMWIGSIEYQVVGSLVLVGPAAVAWVIRLLLACRPERSESSSLVVSTRT